MFTANEAGSLSNVDGPLPEGVHRREQDIGPRVPSFTQPAIAARPFVFTKRLVTSTKSSIGGSCLTLTRLAEVQWGKLHDMNFSPLIA